MVGGMVESPRGFGQLFFSMHKAAKTTLKMTQLRHTKHFLNAWFPSVSKTHAVQTLHQQVQCRNLWTVFRPSLTSLAGHPNPIRSITSLRPLPAQKHPVEMDHWHSNHPVSCRSISTLRQTIFSGDHGLWLSPKLLDRPPPFHRPTLFPCARRHPAEVKGRNYHPKSGRWTTTPSEPFSPTPALSSCWVSFSAVPGSACDTPREAGERRWVLRASHNTHTGFTAKG